MNPKSAQETPVILRARISRAMAYPVGYEFLRDHFRAGTESVETRIWFRAHPTTFMSEFAEVLHTGEPYPILRLKRCSQSFDAHPLPAHWEFVVHPVASRLRAAARVAITVGVLAEMQDFLVRCPTHQEYSNNCFALFDPAKNFCKFSQLHPLPKR